MDLSVKFCGVSFKNPLVLASGILGVTASTWQEVVRNGAGGITTKSIWLEPHKGHPNPVIIANEHFMLNAVGLPDGGVKKAHEEIGKYSRSKKAPLIASIVAYSDDHFRKLTREIVTLKPDIIEVNLSCPNVDDEFGQPFACSAFSAEKVTKLVKKNAGKIPVVIKLSPNVFNIAVIAKACAEAGADGFTCVNTLSGMVINVDVMKPVLANKVGGVSGHAIKPVAVKAVYDVYRATGLPIIGTGGVTTGEDAIEMMLAGATLVGVGTAIYYRGEDVFKKIMQEMRQWGKKQKIKALQSIIGAVDKMR